MSCVFTPLTTGGLWKDMPIPSLALSSMVSPFISLPLNFILPFVTLYFGKPIIVISNVLLPAPFGPNRTWVSPFCIVRLTS